MSPTQKRMSEMMELIDDSIMLLLACAMLQRSGEIMDGTIGEDARKRMFAELSE